MAFDVRRVVTGHDDDGEAIVLSNDLMTEVISFRRGMDSHVAWASDRLPADNTIATGVHFCCAAADRKQDAQG